MKRAVYFSTGLVLFLALALLWIPWLGETLFYSKGEPREAIVAMSMIQSGDWVLPVSFGADIPYKPPFMAWLIAIFAWIFNGGVVNEFVSRLPSALAAIALVMGCYRWVRDIRGEQFALFMSLILAGSIEFYRAATACRVDMVLTACMVGAILLLFQVRQHRGQDNFGRYCLVTLLLTAAVLTKGPVGAFLPCLVAGFYLVLHGDRFFPTLGRMAALCFAACILPAIWYYFAWREGGQPFIQLVWEENFGRLTGTMSYESHNNPFWYNFVTVIVGMLPWTLLVLMASGALRRLIQRPFKPAGLLSITAIVVVIGFYCFPSSKRSVYLLPAYPFMAYAVASMAESLVETRINNAFTRVLAVLAIAAPVAVIATVWVPVSGFSFTPVGWWVWPLLALPPVVAIGWMIQAVPRGNIGGAVLIVWAMLICYGGAVMPAALNSKSAVHDAEDVLALARGKAEIYTVGSGQSAPSYCLNFYLGDRMKRIPTVAEAADAPVGTVLVFPNRKDTVGLPAGYRLTLLTDRAADTRRPMLVAVRTAVPKPIEAPNVIKEPKAPKDLKTTTAPVPSEASELSENSENSALSETSRDARADTIR